MSILCLTINYKCYLKCFTYVTHLTLKEASIVLQSHFTGELTKGQKEHSYTDSKWQGWDLNPCSLASESTV